MTLSFHLQKDDPSPAKVKEQTHAKPFSAAFIVAGKSNPVRACHAAVMFNLNSLTESLLRKLI